MNACLSLCVMGPVMVSRTLHNDVPSPCTGLLCSRAGVSACFSTFSQGYKSSRPRCLSVWPVEQWGVNEKEGMNSSEVVLGILDGISVHTWTQLYYTPNTLARSILLLTLLWITIAVYKMNTNNLKWRTNAFSAPTVFSQKLCADDMVHGYSSWLSDVLNSVTRTI